jgi:hypothetical protein
MYQRGDLLWIPAGTLMMRPRVIGEDDLFSNFYQTTSPCVALFLEFHRESKCVVMMDGQDWCVDTKNVRHNIREENCVG